MELSPVAGQIRARKVVRKLISERRLPHAILLTGKEGIGKKAFAVAVAKSLLCEKPLGNAEACGECGSCRRVDALVHKDLLIVGTEGNVIKIDQIRAIMEETAYRTTKGRFRVIIIEEAEKLGDEASNALLKILEEPPEGNVFILTSSRHYRILPTIRSRCCRIALQPVAQADLMKALRGHRQDLSELDATSCVLLADGSYRRLMELIAGEAPAPWKTVSSQVESITRAPMWQFFSEVGKWLGEYDDVATLLQHLKVWLIIFIRNIASHSGESFARYIDKCLDFFETIEEAEQALRFNVNKTLLLEEIGLQIKEDLYGKTHWS